MEAAGAARLERVQALASSPEPLRPRAFSQAPGAPSRAGVAGARAAGGATAATVSLAPHVGVRVIPPVNFGMVEEGLYRCGQPSEQSYPFLEQLGLKSVIYLAQDDPPETFRSFVEDQGAQLVHLGWEEGRNARWKPMSEETVLRALDIILERRHYPILMLCAQGTHRTSTVVGCLRKLQRWNLTSIFEEYRRYAGAKIRLLNEQFIELFDTDLVQKQHSTVVSWLSPPARTTSGGDVSPPTHPQPGGAIDANGGQEMVTPRGAHPASPPLGSSPEALSLT